MTTRAAVSMIGLAVAASSLAAPLRAATICVSPLGGACQATIQGAVDAAGPGDVVSIQAGTYYENVLVPAGKDGLQLVGVSKLTVIVDPAPYVDRGRTSTDTAIYVEARNVTVKNLTVRNAVDGGITATGRGAIIQGVKVVGLSNSGIRVAGWYSQVLLNEVEGLSRGILSDGYGSVVRGNTVLGAGEGIWLNAAGNQALSNRVYEGARGIVATADGSTIKGNDLRRQADVAITVTGASPVVEGNSVEGAKEGIVATCVDCFGGSVSANRLANLAGYGVVASADGVGLLVQGNQLLRTGRGLSLNGIGVTARLNKATDVGLDFNADCFEAFGSAHTLSQNTAIGCAREGIFVNAADATLDRNVTTGTFQNGIHVKGDDGLGGLFSGVVVEGNKTSGSSFQGIAVLGAEGTIVRNNVSTKNRIDFCNDGTNTSLSGNTFGTITDSLGTDCVIMRE